MYLRLLLIVVFFFSTDLLYSQSYNVSLISEGESAMFKVFNSFHGNGRAYDFGSTIESDHSYFEISISRFVNQIFICELRDVKSTSSYILPVPDVVWDMRVVFTLDPQGAYKLLNKQDPLIQASLKEDVALARELSNPDISYLDNENSSAYRLWFYQCLYLIQPYVKSSISDSTFVEYIYDEVKGFEIPYEHRRTCTVIKDLLTVQDSLSVDSSSLDDYLIAVEKNKLIKEKQYTDQQADEWLIEHRDRYTSYDSFEAAHKADFILIDGVYKFWSIEFKSGGDIKDNISADVNIYIKRDLDQFYPDK